MKEFEIIIYGPYESYPQATFYLMKADKTKGILYDRGYIYLDKFAIDDLLENSKEFQTMVKNSKISRGNISLGFPSKTYDVINKNKTIKDCFEEYISFDRLNAAFSKVHKTYQKMNKDLANKIKQTPEVNNAYIVDENGGHASIIVTTNSEYINKEFLSDMTKEILKKHLSKLNRPIIYNYKINDIELFRARIDFRNTRFRIEEDKL